MSDEHGSKTPGDETPPETATPLRPWWRRKRSWALGIFVGLFGWYLWPIVNPHWAQDACSFGIVSNEQYRSLLDRAKVRADADWGQLRELVQDVDQEGAKALLQSQFDDLSDGMVSMAERVAAMHAVMRANGAEYRNNRYKATRVDPEGQFYYYYHLDVNKFVVIQPLRRWITIRSSFELQIKPLTQSYDLQYLVPYVFRIPTFSPTFTYHTHSASLISPNCPPGPSVDSQSLHQ